MILLKKTNRFLKVEGYSFLIIYIPNQRKKFNKMCLGKQLIFKR